MKSVELWFWLLPRGPGRKPTRSRWKMTAEEAAARGAVERVEWSREVREMPENVRERELHQLTTDTSPGAAARVRALKGRPEMIRLPVRRMPLPAIDLLDLPVRQVRWLDDFWAPAADKPNT